MTEHDLLEVVEIEEDSGLSRWGWAAYYAELHTRNRVLMIIARMTRPLPDYEKIAGYIVAREMAGELHINNVAVREGYRRRGIGTCLLQRVLDQGRQMGARTAFLEVRSGNHAAQSLYKTCGFKPVSVRANYYSEPREDAVVMSLTIEDSCP
jgi:ribosomal-protein-alanine N-acetyltransferase